MKRNIGSATRVAAAVALALCMAGSALAGPLERAQAKRIHDRIAGVPPTESVLNIMEALIVGGDAAGAAREAMKARTFYTTTLKNWVTPWTNRDQTVFAPLNDYTATVIGMVRDDVDFSTALSADLVYTSTASGLPAPAAGNNDHYATAETNGVDLFATLKANTQSAVYGFPAAAIAGLMTTRGGASAFFVAGTNRAM